jgi:hypothetical protein
MHDYNCGKFRGAKQAVEDAEKLFGPLKKFPLPDFGGTLVITK